MNSSLSAKFRVVVFGGIFVPLLICFQFLTVSNSFSTTAGSSPPEKKLPPQTISPPVITPEVSAGKDSSGKNNKYAAIPILNEEQARTLDKESAQSDDIPLLDKESQAKLDVFQEKGSALVLSAADWVDSFFDDPRYLSEENRTRARIKLGLGYSEYYELETYSAIDLRLNLPRLENKANIFLRLNDDSDFDAASSPIPNTEGGRKNEGEKVTAGVQYFLAMGEKYNVSTEFGVSLSYIYGGLRYRHLHPLFNDDWSGRFTNRLRYYSDEGWENKTSYDIERYLGERFFYRTTFTALLSERNDGIPFSAVARLYQVFDIDRVLLYDVGSYFNTEPDLEVTDIQLKLRYRQRFYRDWLVLEIAPQITFPKDYDHAFNPGIITKFEFDFGYLKDRQAFQSVFAF